MVQWPRNPRAAQVLNSHPRCTSACRLHSLILPFHPANEGRTKLTAKHARYSWSPGGCQETSRRVSSGVKWDACETPKERTCCEGFRQSFSAMSKVNSVKRAANKLHKAWLRLISFSYPLRNLNFYVFLSFIHSCRINHISEDLPCLHLSDAEMSLTWKC